MIDELSVLESIAYLRRFLNTSQQSKVKSNCSLCQHNYDIESTSNILLTDYNRINRNIALDHSANTKHVYTSITHDINASWSAQEEELEIKKMITRNNSEHLSNSQWRELNKSLSSSSLTHTESEITELIASSKIIAPIAIRAVDQTLESRIDAKVSTVPYFHYQSKSSKTIPQQRPQHAKGDCSEYQICAELVYAENNKSLSLEPPETEVDHQSTSQLNLILTDAVHNKPTQVMELTKLLTDRIISNIDNREDEAITNEKERPEVSSTHIEDNACFHNGLENGKTVLAIPAQCINDDANNNGCNVINNTMTSSENLGAHYKQSITLCVETEKEELVVPYSLHQISNVSSLFASKHTNNSCVEEEEERESLSSKSSELLSQPSMRQENEEREVLSSAKMINVEEKPSLDVANNNNNSKNVDDDDDECKTDNSIKEACVTHSASVAATQSNVCKEEHESAKNERALDECQEQTSLEQGQHLVDNKIKNNSSEETIIVKTDSNERIYSSSSNSNNNNNNNISNRNIENTNNTVDNRTNISEHEVNENNNNSNGNDFNPIINGINNNECESGAPIAQTVPELEQTGSSSRLVHEHTLSQLWQLLQRGSILLKHIHRNRRPHKRFFCIQNVKCYLEGSKAVVPHLVWRSASRREIQQKTKITLKQEHNLINNKQCTHQTPNDANEEENNSDSNKISINDRKSVSSSGFCTSGNPFRSEHLLNLITLSSCEELQEETLQDKTSVAHELFATRNGCAVDDHWQALPYSTCAIWTFTTRSLAVSFCNGEDRELWQRAMNYIVYRNKQLFN